MVGNIKHTKSAPKGRALCVFKKKMNSLRYGTHEGAYKKNKKRIFATQSICGICGRPVDFSLKYPNPLSATIDHIVPVAKGGHPSDIDNLQLAHFSCNRQKSDHYEGDEQKFKAKRIEFEIKGNRNLPLSKDWFS